MLDISTDMLLMTLVIFLPSVFAIGLLFFPKGTEEWMRWFALLGSGITLVVSLFMLVDYVNLLESDTTHGERAAIHGPAASLDTRVADADRKASQGHPDLPKDYIARRPWIQRFNI